MSGRVAPADAAEVRRWRVELERIAEAEEPLDESTIECVVDCLAIAEKAVQRLAADLLQRVIPSQRMATVRRLRSALGSDDADWRWGAAYALGRLGVALPEMMVPLLEALGGSDGDRRWAAAEVLARCARSDRELVMPSLVAAADDVDPVRRKMALYTLRNAGPAHPDVPAATLRRLTDRSVGVRFAALAVLVRLEPIPAQACALVLALARADADPGVRRAALCALGNVGRGVSAAEAAIAAAESSDDPLWRRAATIARRRLAE